MKTDGLVSLFAIGRIGAAGALAVAAGLAQAQQCPFDELFVAPTAIDGDPEDVGETQTGQLVVADFDNDGRLDIITAGITFGQVSQPIVSFIEGNGDGTFDDAELIEGFNNFLLAFSFALIAEDVNSDGELDLIVTDAVAGAAVALGNGDGTFATPTRYETGGGAFGVAAGDFNADGAPDLAFANKFEDVVTIRLGDGDGGFGPLATFPVNDSPFWITSADFDGDGDDDLAVSHVDADGFDAADEASILLSNGDGTFQPAQVVLVGDQPVEVIAADLNGDGSIDLATANSGSGNPGVSVLLGNGDGTFQTATTPSNASGTAGLTAADIDNDGVLDLVTVNAGTDNASVLLGNGDGSFAAPMQYATGDRNPQMVASGDFDGDGDLDLGITQFFFGDVSILLNQGGGAYETPTFFAGLDLESPVHGDFNDDGITDIAMTVRNPSGSLSVLFGKLDGGFEPAVSFLSDPILGQIVSLVQTQDLLVVDFNDDGIDDLVSINQGSPIATVALHPSLGDGTFDEPTSITLSVPGASGAAAGDFDGDGDTDIAVTAFDDSSVSGGTGKLLLLNNDGSGSFTQSVQDAGKFPSAILAVDLDTDGDLDLAVSSRDQFGNGQVDFLSNDGTGSFTIADTEQTGGPGQPSDLAVIDIDFGGGPDVVAVQSDGNDGGFLAIFINRDIPGFVSFRSPAQFDAGQEPRRIAVGDLNGDGFDDVAVTNDVGDTDDTTDTPGPFSFVGLLFGDGDGGLGGFGFGVPLELRVNDGAGGVIATDLDNDGDIDLGVITNSRHSSGFNVLANQCLTPPPPPSCPADLTGPTGEPDGVLDASDFFAYLGLFAAGDPGADLTGGPGGTPDGVIDASDFFLYLNLFAAGCP